MDVECDIAQKNLHLVVTRDNEDNVVCHFEPKSLEAVLENCDRIIGHNLISFDVTILRKLWNLTLKRETLYDTLIVSRLLQPDRPGGHSLEAWGEKLNCPKGNFSDFETYSEEMKDYCIQDTMVTMKLYHHLQEQLKKGKFSPECVELEHKVACVIQKQVEHGWLFDEPAAHRLMAELSAEYQVLHNQLVEEYEPNVIVIKTKSRTEPFNPSSRQQIADRLVRRGWKPKILSPTGRPVVDEKTLSEAGEIGAPFLRYFLLEKRISQLKQWIEYCEDDGRVHGKVITIGTVTGRMSHNRPNMAQVPANDKEYGVVCRSLFKAPEALVGVDASQLELRMLAHYMQDPEYIRELCEGDIHERNRVAAGLETRAQAKTFIYAMLYGAGAEKIGSIVGGGAVAGKKLIDEFLRNLPALAELKAKVARIAKKGTIPGLDGRRIWIRQEHKALNALLQGAGAILMKQAAVVLNQQLTDRGDVAIIVGNIHDEFQIESPFSYAEEVGKLGVWSIEEAGRLLGLRCPVTGEYHVGKNWSETH